MVEKIRKLTFEERAKLFKESVQRAEKKYGVEICAGYINSYDDSENLIIQEVKRKDNIEYTTNEVYFDTLKDYL